MEKWKGRVCLVTGASAGIGAALVKVLVKEGLRVAGCARRKDRLEALRDSLDEADRSSFLPLTCDLTQEEQIKSVFASIVEIWGGVDVLINNAGIGFPESMQEGKTEEWKLMLDINVLAVLIATREALQDMKRRGVDDGHIIHISSLSGHRLPIGFGTPGVYAATKFALRSLAESLRIELRHRDPPSRIRVTLVSPGLVKTDFAENKLGDKDKAENLYNTNPHLEAEDVAAAVIYALSAPPRVDVNDILIRPTEQKN